MDEVIDKLSLIKSVRVDVKEYYTELPLVIAVLERRLGFNVDVVASTIIDDPEVVTEDGDDEE